MAGKDPLILRRIATARSAQAPGENPWMTLSSRVVVERGRGGFTAVDGLTGVSDHRYFRRVLEEAVGRARQQATVISLVLVDIDHLKTYNETFGHRAGDDVLRSMADLLRANVTLGDLVALGGGQFAVMMESNGGSAALGSAERLRRSIEENDWPLGSVTASLGVATCPPVVPEAARLIERAFGAVQEAKRLGGNCVSHADATANGGVVS